MWGGPGTIVYFVGTAVAVHKAADADLVDDDCVGWLHFGEWQNMS